MGLLNTNIWQDHDSELARISYSARMLYLLRGAICLDRMELAKRLGVTWPTASNTAEKLQKIGALRTVAQEAVSETGSGKSSYSLMVNPDYGYFVGISIGSSEIKLVVLDFNFDPLSKVSLQDYLCFYAESEGNPVVFDWRKYLMQSDATTNGYIKIPTPESAERFSATINQIVNGLIAADINQQNQSPSTAKHLLGIGFAFTGAVDVENKTVTESFNLPFLRGISYKTLISPSNREYLESQNITVSFQHNAKTVAIAEKYYLQKNNSPLGESEDIVSIYLGTGIGCGLILNNRLFTGIKNYSGELGHIPLLIQSNKAITLEEYIRIYVFGESDFDTYRKMKLSQLREILNQSVEAQKHFSQALGYAINTVATLFNPSLIILSGKLSELASTCLDSIYSYQFSALPYVFDSYKLQISEQGICSPAIGAAMYAFYARYDINVQF